MPYANLTDRRQHMRDYREQLNLEEKRAQDRLNQEMSRLEREIGGPERRYRIMDCYKEVEEKYFIRKAVTEFRSTLWGDLLSKAFTETGELYNRGPIILDACEPRGVWKNLLFVKRMVVREDRVTTLSGKLPDGRKGYFTIHTIVVLDREIIPKLSKEEREEIRELEEEGGRWHDIEYLVGDMYLDKPSTFGAYRMIVWGPSRDFFSKYFVQPLFLHPEAWGDENNGIVARMIIPHTHAPNVSKHSSESKVGRHRKLVDKV